MKRMRTHHYAVTVATVGLVAAVGLWLTSQASNADDDPSKSSSSTIVAAARGLVDVEGGLLKLTAPRDGLVLSVAATEGKYVRAGDVMAILDTRQVEREAKIAAEEVVQAEEHYKILQLKAKSLSRQVERMRRAATEKAVSDQSLDEVLSTRDNLASEMTIAASVLSAARSKRDMAQAEVEVRSVRAPVDGLVIRQTIKAGEMVSAQSMTDMFTLLPAGPKIVKAEIAEQFLEGIKPGVAVEVLAEDRTTESYRGRISRISPVLMPSNNPAAGERNDMRTATSIVMISQDTPFRIGQRVIVRVYQ